jgi:hypothetical protein
VLGLLLLSFARLTERISLRQSIIFLFSLGLFLFVKTYVLMIILPGLIAWWWIARTSYRFTLVKFMAIYILAGAVLFNLHHMIEHFDVAYLVYIKQQNFIHLAEATEAGSLLRVKLLEPTFVSLVSNAPAAVFHTLTRPYLFESMSPLYLLAGLENLIILLLGSYYLWCARLPFASPKQKVLFMFSVFLVLILFALIGLVTPVMGAMVRYKAVGLPFLMVAFIIMSDDNKVFRNLKFPGRLFTIFEKPKN